MIGEELAGGIEDSMHVHRQPEALDPVGPRAALLEPAPWRVGGRSLER